MKKQINYKGGAAPKIATLAGVACYILLTLLSCYVGAFVKYTKASAASADSIAIVDGWVPYDTYAADITVNCVSDNSFFIAKFECFVSRKYDSSGMGTVDGGAGYIYKTVFKSNFADKTSKGYTNFILKEAQFAVNKTLVSKDVHYWEIAATVSLQSVLERFSVTCESTALGVLYSDVLDDLQKDKIFDLKKYKQLDKDYSLQILQVAESVNGEVFIYCYQPSGHVGKLRASSINISIGIGDNLQYFNYKLELLNSNGVFFKYLVKNLTVKSGNTRYYAITSIYRSFNKDMDNPADFDNTVTEVGYSVNKQYCYYVENGKLNCSVIDIETIVITNKFVGFVRYDNGFHLYLGACDGHFVAFDTDKPMDKLLEADVYYTMQSYGYSFVPTIGETHEFGDVLDKYGYLTYTDKVEHTGSGLFAGTYKWNRIETVEQFIYGNTSFQNVYSGAILNVNVANKITDSGKAALRGKKWVLRFAETSFSFSTSSGGVSTSFSSLVGDVSILRLKFETDGKVYNMGVIDNKQTGGDKPSNDEDVDVELNDFWSIILPYIIVFFVLIVLAPFLPGILGFVAWIVLLPFRALWALLKAIGSLFEKKDTKTNNMDTVHSLKYTKVIEHNDKIVERKKSRKKKNKKE